MKTHAPRRSGFTLIELLIVIGIIGILAGLVSTAIVKIVSTANEKRVKNNAKRLEAAIQEYWHDLGRWPLPKDLSTKLRLKGAGTVSAELGSSTEVKVYSYKLYYGNDGRDGTAGTNDEIVDKLLQTPVPGSTGPKDFLDLHGFSVPVGKPPYTWPVTEVEDAFSSSNSTHVLVYYTQFLKCPVCRHYALASATDCPNDDCDYYKSNTYGAGKKKRYRFTKEQKSHPVAGAVPYVIEFDLDNNVVTVHDNPGMVKLDAEAQGDETD